MNGHELRLDCVRIALDILPAGSSADEVMALADTLFKFILNKLD